MIHQSPHAGDYYRIDYDSYLARFSHHLPGWWNVREYLDGSRLIDAGWFDAATSGISTGREVFVIGWLADDCELASASVVGRDATSLAIDLTLNRQLAAKVLLICGVENKDERRRLREFNATARKPGGHVEEGWPRPYRVRERPLCASVWLIDKNDADASNTVNCALQAMAAAYFRLKWVA